MIGCCSFCNSEAKYKCPTCAEPYCSVKCYKKHREVPCKSVPVQNVEKTIEPKKIHEFPTSDTVDPEKLELLEHSKELRNILVNPHLRQILEELYQSPYPDSLMEKYMQEPIFTEFADECLRIVQTKDS